MVYQGSDIMTEKRFTCETKTQGSVSIDLMKDNGQIIEKFEAINLLNELHEENQRYQQILDDMLQNERTQIGQSVLKQYKEAIQ